MDEKDTATTVKEDSRISLPIGTLIFSIASIIGIVVAGVTKYNSLEAKIIENKNLIILERMERISEDKALDSRTTIVEAKTEANRTGILEIQAGITDIQSKTAVIIERLDWVIKDQESQ